jgi:hypothetical protein
VLAVPDAKAAALRPNSNRMLAMIATLVLTLMSVAGVAMAQHGWSNVAAITAFQRAADSYAFLHRQAERQLGLAHRAQGAPNAAIEARELSDAIRARGARSGGELFAPAVVREFRALAASAVHASCNAGALRTGVWELAHTVYAPADGSEPVAACIAAALPPLPAELEYRSAGTVLLVVDPHANLVVDILPALLAGSDVR